MAYINQIEALYRSGLPAGHQVMGLNPIPVSQGAQAHALMVAPHPDDECLMSGYALRLAHEASVKVSVVPFSLGSNSARQAARDQELNEAIAHLGFSRVTGTAGTADQIFQLLCSLKPSYVFSPHEFDGHVTHQKTFFAVKEALVKFLGSSSAEAGQKINWLQTEYWQSLPSPNLLVNLTSVQVIQMGEALMKHQGEISRNPYHLSLPAWLIDQVRRGSERVLGAGHVHSGFVFGELYTQIECMGGDPSQWVPAPALAL